MTRLMNAVLVILLAVVTAGCAGIPTQELSQYRTAFAATQQASVDILVDFAAATAAAEKLKAPAGSKLVGSPFSSDLENSAARQPDAIEVRRLAFRTIDKFNNVLVSLAEGKSVEAVQSTASGFIQAASQFAEMAAGVAVPGLSAVISAVNTLVGELEKARLREEFVAAVRHGAPVIDKILMALIEERSEHIALRANEADQRQADLIGTITSLTSRSVDQVVVAHSTPPSNDPLQKMQDDLHQALEPAREEFTGGILPTLRYSSGTPPFDAGQRAIVDSAIVQIRDLVASYQANKESFFKLRSALIDYRSMLETTRSALKTLSDSLDKPIRFEDTSEQLFQIVFNLKRDIEAFKAARKAAN